jgi:hypothetical protein
MHVLPNEELFEMWMKFLISLKMYSIISLPLNVKEILPADTLPP